MITRQMSQQDIIKERYKDSITCFLRDTKLYDCLAHNNQITVIDQSFSCYDVIQIFLQHHVEEVVFWNSEINNYDGVFTHTDIIRVVLRFYRVESSLEEETQLSTRDRILMRMKSVTITEWFKNYENDVTTLVKAKMDERLHDACRKLIFSNIHRIIIIDNDSRMLVGTIQQRDILVYLIKGYSQYLAEFLAANNMFEHEQQHKLEIGYFFKEDTERKCACVDGATKVFQVFHDLVYVDRRTSVPVVNREKAYLGTLHRRDFLFILRGDSFDWFEQPVEQFLAFVKNEKKSLQIYQLLTKDTFTMQQTVKEVVENLVLSESCFLVCLKDQQIQQQLSVQDIFAFFLSEE